MSVEIKDIDPKKVTEAIAALIGADSSTVLKVEVASFHVSVVDPEAFNGYRYYHVEIS